MYIFTLVTEFIVEKSSEYQTTIQFEQLPKISNLIGSKCIMCIFFYELLINLKFYCKKKK